MQELLTQLLPKDTLRSTSKILLYAGWRRLQNEVDAVAASNIIVGCGFGETGWWG